MSNNKDIYSQLGVSSKKEDVHKAIQFYDKGLYPGSFCKIVQDVIYPYLKELCKTLLL